MLKSNTFLTTLLLCVFLLSCGSDALEEATPTPSEPEEPKAVAVTGLVVRKGKDYADLSGQVNLSSLGLSIEDVEFGIELATNDEFKDAERKPHMEMQDNNFAVRFYRLTPEKLYFYRTYVQTHDQRYLGRLLWFRTEADKEIPPDIHDCVDLGLPSGTLWATMNVGASAPYEIGDYFAWSEIYPFKIQKYDDKSGKYSTDSLTELLPEDDAARANWGPNWTMPTSAQIEELLEECSWGCAYYDDVPGYMVRSTKNANYMFLPFSGYLGDDSSYGKGDDKYDNGCGYYWSKSIYGKENDSFPGAFNSMAKALYLFVNQGHYLPYYIYEAPRSAALSVRAVRVQRVKR